MGRIRMYKCQVKTCNNRSSYGIENEIKLHKFPSNENTRKQWLESLDLKDLKIKESMRICSDHFTEEDYMLQNFTNLRILKPGAIPTILSPDDLKTQNSSKMNSPERSANTPLHHNNFDMEPSGSDVEGSPSNGSQYPVYVPSLSVVEGCKKPLQALQLLHSYRKILPKTRKTKTRNYARKSFSSKLNMCNPNFPLPSSPEKSLENGQVHLTRSIAQIHQPESLQIDLDPSICSFVQSTSKDSNTESEKEDARENSDVLEESEISNNEESEISNNEESEISNNEESESDNEEIEENLVRKKRKIHQKSVSSEREVLNASSSSAKKHYDSASWKNSHSNSSSAKKVHNTSVSQKKFHIPSLQKKHQRSLSPEKKLHNFSSQKKMNNSLYSETDQKNSSLSQKERKNSSSSDNVSPTASKVSSPSDIIDNVSALNSWDKEDIFAQYVASELRALKNYPQLYLQTKQAIIKSITSANEKLLNLDS